MPITTPYANVNSSPVLELKTRAIDSCKTQQPYTKGKSWETLHCHISDNKAIRKLH